MKRLIDDTAEENASWIHAVEVGGDFLTFWVKNRRKDVDERFPVHSQERFHNNEAPQDWVAERWPGKRWAAHFHVTLDREPHIADCVEFQDDISPALWPVVAETLRR